MAPTFKFDQTSFFEWAIPALFLFIFVFSIQFTVKKMFNIKIYYDWIQTADLWVGSDCSTNKATTTAQTSYLLH